MSLADVPATTSIVLEPKSPCIVKSSSAKVAALPKLTAVADTVAPVAAEVLTM